MVIAVLADESIKNEILAWESSRPNDYVWADSLSSLIMIEADLYFDLKFEMDVERTGKLRRLLPKPVFIGAVIDTLASIGEDRFIRINSWQGMIGRETRELAFADQNLSLVNSLVESLGWKSIRVPDLPGMVTPRILATIINEAFFAVQEGVSSRSGIDLAMKSGTSYPFGPFEWAEKIGPAKILKLLRYLQKGNTRYEVSDELVKEAAAKKTI